MILHFSTFLNAYDIWWTHHPKSSLEWDEKGISLPKIKRQRLPQSWCLERDKNEIARTPRTPTCDSTSCTKSFRGKLKSEQPRQTKVRTTTFPRRQSHTTSFKHKTIACQDSKSEQPNLTTRPIKENAIKDDSNCLRPSNKNIKDDRNSCHPIRNEKERSNGKQNLANFPRRRKSHSATCNKRHSPNKILRSCFSNKILRSCFSYGPIK